MNTEANSMTGPLPIQTAKKRLTALFSSGFRPVSMIAVAFIVAGLQACSFVTSQSVYEGIRGAEKTKTTGTTQTPAALPNFDRYEKEREVLKK